MPQKRITVKKSKEIIRLCHQGELRQRQIARALNLSRVITDAKLQKIAELKLQVSA